MPLKREVPLRSEVPLKSECPGAKALPLPLSDVPLRSDEVLLVEANVVDNLLLLTDTLVLPLLLLLSDKPERLTPWG